MKKFEKIRLIPRHTFYCYDHKRKCPFLTYKKTDFGFKTKGEKKEPAEYCKYLHKFLDIQDQVKDCDFDCGW